jgi:5-methylcytosine-specific restriction endonuclease McrA
VKKESQFRYIKYLDKRRIICKRCEAREKQKKKRFVEQHVKEYGVTPGIRSRLEIEARLRAEKQAKETVLVNLSQDQREMYRWSQRVDRIRSIVLILAIVFGLIALIVRAFEWLTLPFMTGVLVVAGRRYFHRRHADPVNAEITRHRDSLYQALLQEELQKRIEYERFYTSPEWRILRESFLRTCKKNNENYVCDYCQEPIAPYDLSVDHFKPRSKFPDLALEITNLRVAHRRCNSSKGSKVLYVKNSTSS